MNQELLTSKGSEGRSVQGEDKLRPYPLPQ